MTGKVSRMSHHGEFRIARWFAFLNAVVFASFAAFAQSPNKPASARSATSETRVARAFDALRTNPLELREFLYRMPKGADLHYHLSGGVYTESWVRAGAEDHLCVNLSTLAFAKPAASGDSAQPSCAQGKVPAAQAYADQHLYDSLIDSFSMRSFVPSAAVSGHDHFFDTFAKFGGTDPRHIPEWLDEAATRAAAQNEQYLEIMETPDFSSAAAIASAEGWSDNLAKLRDDLFTHGLRDNVASASAHFDQIEAAREELEHCGQPDAAPACRVQIRFLYQVLRGLPKQIVFAQALFAFEVASADPRVVGINFVMPEDGYTSMYDYALHMKMVGFLHSVYPKVHISLHAGELAPGLVPYEGLCCHIRLAVEQAHAERIGHGVDVMYEDRPYDLLREIAAKHVMVEINLTSNDVILGIKDNEHPFPIYRKFRVPVALSTDDEGVSRIDLTHEFVRAVETYNLSYADLKQLIRTGLEHSFLPGAGLWRAEDNFARPVAACAKDAPGADNPSSSCADFLQSSEKAAQQWELERRFRAFEASF
jgi:adenosine deaminase